MKHVVISPHFDDAIGSCGATLNRLRRNGEEVVIHTVFAGIPSPPFSGLAVKLHTLWACEDSPVSTRREEDARACDALGFAQQVTDIPEALYRKSAGAAHLYPDEQSLFGAIAPEERQLHLRICGDLGTESKYSDLCFYVPLGVGHHVDHVIAFHAGLELLRQGYPVWFYQEFFYTDWNCQHLRGRKLRASVQSYSATDLEQKVGAFSHYKSQILMLFGNASGAMNYFAGTDDRPSSSHFEEVFWQLDCNQ